MGGIEPFTPDDEYCVYCHAPAAGMCAECGALCCPDCVELVMGWTTQRAVCRSCTRELPRSESHRPLVWLGALAAVAAAIWLARGI